jgi:hypothetical protein
VVACWWWIRRWLIMVFITHSIGKYGGDRRELHQQRDE